ncbi:MAG: metallophosphoesterase [Actinomycetota bacterium]
MAAAIWAIFIERALFVIRRQSIKVLPSGSEPIRVLQIGDIHLAPWQKRKISFLKSLSNQDFDFVVNTGDNLGHKNAVPSLVDALGPILKRPGVFVNGSNDYFAPVPKNPLSYLLRSSAKPNSAPLDTDSMVSAFEKSGWVNLNNSNAKLKINNLEISFIGVDDRHINRADLSKVSAGEGFTIALTHAPYLEILEGLTDLGASVIFAGHTHGGQVRLPIIGALTTNCDLPNAYARGLSGWEFGERSVILSVVAGLGNSIFAPIGFSVGPRCEFLPCSPLDF